MLKKIAQSQSTMVKLDRPICPSERQMPDVKTGQEFGAAGNCVNRKWAIDQLGRAGRGGVTRAEGRGAEARPVAVWAGGACRGRRAFPPGSRARSLPIHF
ncbi:unnamed protein product [Arctia plantaginis]|uniref:Uncharacterized protein n=1 Tax=Arctia plantaginis TaxID=874455 RepID=A0A8S1A7I9_ARCPL|nr:unnamed protein product [Arctia plantaginis]CAB3254822.1 unnamed protein product [Arctia plantaginis]